MARSGQRGKNSRHPAVTTGPCGPVSEWCQSRCRLVPLGAARCPMRAVPKRGASGRIWRISAGLGWCCWRGLNSRPLPYQGSALPLSYNSAGPAGGTVSRRMGSPTQPRCCTAPPTTLAPPRPPRHLRAMTTPPKPPAPDKRAERLAAALRENLKRRKAQARARTAQPEAEPATPQGCPRPAHGLIGPPRCIRGRRRARPASPPSNFAGQAQPMPIMPDHLDPRHGAEHGMIDPFVERQTPRGRDLLRPVLLRLRRARRRRVQDLHQCRQRDGRSQAFQRRAASSTRNDRVCIIPPNSFALARTVEYFRIPRDVLVICLGKSTYARCGIIVNVTPLEPEWEGHVTLEFSNTTPLPAKVYANEGACQFLFLKGECAAGSLLCRPARQIHGPARRHAAEALKG